MIRALEFYRQTGKRISEHNEQERGKESPWNLFYYVLTMERSLLYDRINRRVDRMMEQGLPEEVERLRQMGCRADMTSMQGLGYKEILAYLEHGGSLAETAERIKQNTRHFAKRQLTWFRRERDVRWLYADQMSEEEMLARITEDLSTGKPER